jgi:hypothetical protein
MGDWILETRKPREHRVLAAQSYNITLNADIQATKIHWEPFQMPSAGAHSPLAANQLAGGGDFKGATAGEPDGYRIGLLQ